MKNKNITFINLIYFLSISSVALIFVLSSFGIINNEFLSTFLIQCVVLFGVPLLLYTLLVSKNVKQTFADTGFKRISGKMLLITILLGVVLYFINSFVATGFSTIIQLFGYESVKLTYTTTTLDYAYLFKELVLSCILPGICEEFLHRGIMLHANKKYTNPKYALIVSSLLFGCMHLNINQFFYASILGALMGYVALVSDSIIPSMIIHFMNNALSTYFYYGAYANWPLASFVSKLESALLGYPILFVGFISLLIFFLLWAYKYLTRILKKERAKMEVVKIIKYLKANNLTIEQAQEKISQINNILKHSNTLKAENNTKQTFFNKVFLICSFVLGGLVTLCSFIWGII